MQKPIFYRPNKFRALEQVWRRECGEQGPRLARRANNLFSIMDRTTRILFRNRLNLPMARDVCSFTEILGYYFQGTDVFASGGRNQFRAFVETYFVGLKRQRPQLYRVFDKNAHAQKKSKSDYYPRRDLIDILYHYHRHGTIHEYFSKAGHGVSRISDDRVRRYFFKARPGSRIPKKFGKTLWLTVDYLRDDFLSALRTYSDELITNATLRDNFRKRSVFLADHPRLP